MGNNKLIIELYMIRDDFDRLSELGLSDPFADLGKEMMVQKETMFVVSSSNVHFLVSGTVCQWSIIIRYNSNSEFPD